MSSAGAELDVGTVLPEADVAGPLLEDGAADPVLGAPADPDVGGAPDADAVGAADVSSVAAGVPVHPTSSSNPTPTAATDRDSRLRMTGIYLCRQPASESTAVGWHPSRTATWP
ncbi:hypothetical protein [Nakamurella sp. GG22]